MANSVSSTITLNAGYSWAASIGTPFTGILSDNLAPPLYTLNFTVIDSTTAATTGPTSISTVTPGAHDFYLTNIDDNLFSPDPRDNYPLIAATFTLTFDDSPTPSPSADLTPMAETLALFGNVSVNIACLHGSSQIRMRNGTKRIDQIVEGDEVLSHLIGEEEAYTKVKGVAHCWLSAMGQDHDAIIFEAGSLGEKEPNQMLIIDPGHPMCTQEEYLEDGYDALRPAGNYWEELRGDKIYTKKWTDVFVQNEPSRRYDLILEEPFNTYIANGVVVRAKGYKSNTYKHFV